MIAPLILTAMLRSGYFIVSEGLVKLVFEISFYGAVVALGVAGYAAYRQYHLFLLLTMSIALYVIYLGFNATITVQHSG